MGLEAATYIDELVATNPIGGSDNVSQGDDHIRLLKSVLQSTFPNISGAVTLTDTQLNDVARKSVSNSFAQTVNGQIYQEVKNLSTGTAAYAALYCTGDSTYGAMQTTSSTYASSGMSGAPTGTSVCVFSGGAVPLVFGTAATARFWLDGSGNLVTPNTNASEVGFKGVPQNSQSGNYTLVLADAGKHIINSGASAVNTIPANASVAYPIGTTITIVAANSGQTVAITSDTLQLAGTSTTGTRTLALAAVCTLLKITSTQWLAMGPGVS